VKITKIDEKTRGNAYFTPKIEFLTKNRKKFILKLKENLNRPNSPDLGFSHKSMGVYVIFSQENQRKWKFRHYTAG